jgi:peptidoglycan/LPS O-acetylase OafA/YrhL
MHRDNSFDLIRLTAAYAVLFAHHFDLTGNAGPSAFGIGIGGLGVAAFFALSGYLVTGSFIADPHAGRFLARRALRVFPGLIVCVLITALVIGPTQTTMSAREYFSHPEFFKYFKTAVLNIKYQLPGVFVENPYPKIVNGSLWTIPIEFKCYLLIAAAALMAVRYRRIALAYSPCVYLIYFYVVNQIGQKELSFYDMFPLAFLIGSFLRVHEGLWSSSEGRSIILPVGIFVLACPYWLNLNLVFMSIAAVAIVLIGRHANVKLPIDVAKNDISYGVYLYAFPIQQVIYSANFHKTYFWLTLLVVIVATTALAWVSYRVIEAPALKLKPGLPR